MKGKFVKNVVQNEYTVKATYANGETECRNVTAESEKVALNYAYEWWYASGFISGKFPIDYEIVNVEYGTYEE